MLAPEAPVEPLVRLRAEVALAQLAFIAGDYLAPFAAIESAVPAARRAGDDVVLARCLATAGYVWWFLDPEHRARRAGLGPLLRRTLRRGDRAAAGGYRADRPFGTAAARCDGRARPRHARARHPGVLDAQRRERARIRSERQQRSGRPKPKAA